MTRSLRKESSAARLSRQFGNASQKLADLSRIIDELSRYSEQFKNFLNQNDFVFPDWDTVCSAPDPELKSITRRSQAISFVGINDGRTDTLEIDQTFDLVHKRTVFEFRFKKIEGQDIDPDQHTSLFFVISQGGRCSIGPFLENVTPKNTPLAAEKEFFKLLDVYSRPTVLALSDHTKTLSPRLYNFLQDLRNLGANPSGASPKLP